LQLIQAIVATLSPARAAAVAKDDANAAEVAGRSEI